MIRGRSNGWPRRERPDRARDGAGDRRDPVTGAVGAVRDGDLPLLLVVLLVLLVTYPVTTLGAGFAVAYSLAYVALLLVGVRLTIGRAGGRAVLVAAVATGLLVVPWVLTDLVWVDLATYAALLGFQALLIAALLRALFERRRVGVPTLLAGAGVYLLLGNAFTPVHMSIDIVTHALAGVHAYLLPDALGGAAGPTWQTMVYFSFATLTTLGYGDVSPATTVAQAAAALEAVTGQVAVAVLIGRLVGLSTDPPAPGTPAPDPGEP